LRDAWRRWQDLEVPYEAARARLLIARALEGLGDADGAALEVEGARWALQQLGALQALSSSEPRVVAHHSTPGMLTAREREVLALLAAGKTNREISAALVISEHTVARHLQNIFGKIGVSTRSAAIAFAFENRLI
jgi:DNA-binding NarL/FixJ family response regulator